MIRNGYLRTIRRNIPVPEDFDRPLGASQFRAPAPDGIQIVEGAPFRTFRSPQYAARTGAQRAAKLIQRSANGNFLWRPSLHRHAHQLVRPRLVIPKLIAFGPPR